MIGSGTLQCSSRGCAGLKLYGNAQHLSPKEMRGRQIVPKTTLRETEPKTTSSHRKPEVGNTVQFH